MKRNFVIEYSVKVHTCKLLQDYGPGTLEDQMVPDNRYICVRNPRKEEDEEKSYLEEIFKEPEYYRMRKDCKCRKWVTFREAIDLCDGGYALWAYKIKSRQVGKCEPDPPRRNHRGAPIRGALGHIWRPVVVGRVPRIDLITKADIERAYVTDHRTHVVHNGANSGTSFEVQRGNRKYANPSIEKIETIHFMHMQARALLFHGVQLEGGKYKSGAPIGIDDPCEGRCLFPFTADERTTGGHK